MYLAVGDQTDYCPSHHSSRTGISSTIVIFHRINLSIFLRVYYTA